VTVQKMGCTHRCGGLWVAYLERSLLESIDEAAGGSSSKALVLKVFSSSKNTPLCEVHQDVGQTTETNRETCEHKRINTVASNLHKNN
jgi:hypothetical protein